MTKDRLTKTACIYHTGHRERTFLSVGEVPTDKKLLCRTNFPEVHGESVPPPYSSRDLRPILHENISLGVLPASRQVSNEPLFFGGRVGGENGFECKLFPVLNNSAARLFTLFDENCPDFPQIKASNYRIDDVLTT